MKCPAANKQMTKAPRFESIDIRASCILSKVFETSKQKAHMPSFDRHTPQSIESSIFVIT
jgi:hypothetical protein